MVPWWSTSLPVSFTCWEEEIISVSSVIWKDVTEKIEFKLDIGGPSHPSLSNNCIWFFLRNSHLLHHHHTWFMMVTTPLTSGRAIRLRSTQTGHHIPLATGTGSGMRTWSKSQIWEAQYSPVREEALLLLLVCRAQEKVNWEDRKTEREKLRFD